MTDDYETYKRLMTAVMGAFALGASGCGADANQGDDQPPGDVQILQRASRSSTIALADDRAHVAMVNPEDGTLSVFQTSDHARTSKLATGGRPSSVVIAADSTTAFVANRADGTVVRVTGIDGGTPAVDATVSVGAEPVGLALSPTGKRLFVAEFAESRVSVIDTATMTIETEIPVDRPRALYVTNNLDQSDDDEQLIVTQFYGVATPGAEAKDDGRTGKVRVYSLADLTTYKSIALAPIDSGFPKGGVTGNPTVHAAPNQLTAIAVANDRVYVTATEASPEGPPRFDNNLFPVIHVGDLASLTEVTGAGGTTNLARKIYDAIPSPSAASPRFIPGELSDLDFVADSNVAYAVGRAGDVMVRVTFGSTVEIGSTQNKRDRPRRQRPDRQVPGADRRRDRHRGPARLRQLLGDPPPRRRRPRGAADDPDVRVGAAAGDRRRAERAARPPVLLHRPRPVVGERRQRREGGRGLVVVWLVPPRRPDRQRHLGVRRRAAPDDVAGRHVLARPRTAEDADAQLDRHQRRAPRLRAQHARHLGRARRDHDGTDPGRLQPARQGDPGLARRDRGARQAAEGARR